MLPLDDRSKDVHTVAIRSMNIAFVIGLLNILYDIIVIAVFEKDPTPGGVGIARLVINIVDSVVFSLSMVIASIYGSRTLDGSRSNSRPDAQDRRNMVGEVWHRYQNSNLKSEAVRVLDQIKDLNVHETSPYYRVFFRFRKCVLNNLLYRTNLSILMNMLLSFFVFYNYIVLLIYYSKVFPIKGLQVQALYLTLNVVNPFVSLIFSYIVILCDNVNSIVVYIDRARVLKDLPTEELDQVNAQMEEFCDRIDRPFIYELNRAP